jgi:PII-like signaling protein
MIIEQAETLSRLIPIVEDMMDTGLIAMSDVKIKRIQKSQSPQ